jgi:hypothetical protein
MSIVNSGQHSSRSWGVGSTWYRRIVRSRPDDTQLSQLRDYYRSRPPSTANDHKAAGIIAGCTKAMAMRAWSRGWPGIEPINVQLAKERALQQQSLEVLRVENIVLVMKTNALSLQNALHKLRPAFHVIAESVARDLDELAALPIDVRLKMMQRIGKFARDVSAVNAQGVELERLVNNESTVTIGVKHMEQEPVDFETARATHERLGRALRRVEAGELPEADAESDLQQDIHALVSN